MRPPDAPQRAQWLEVAQFQTEDRARQFHEDFMSLVESDELMHVTGPMLASTVADDLGMDSRWQVMDKQTLEQLTAGEWSLTRQREHWQPRLDEGSPQQAMEASNVELDL